MKAVVYLLVFIEIKNKEIIFVGFKNPKLVQNCNKNFVFFKFQALSLLTNDILMLSFKITTLIKYLIPNEHRRMFFSFVKNIMR